MRHIVFSEYVSSYFTHRDPFSRKTADLNFRDPDIDETPTIHRMTKSECSAIIDSTATSRGDHLSSTLKARSLQHILVNIAREALLDVRIRRAWPHSDFYCLWGKKNAWFVPVCIWAIEDMFKEVKDQEVAIHWKTFEEGNHFVSVHTLFHSIHI
jgi:hypothetical protein